LYNEKTVFKNYRIISAQVIAELNIHLENPVSTKTVQCELHKSNNHGRLQLLNLCLVKVTFRCINNLRHDHETFFLRRPNLFAICNNTSSKWWESVKTWKAENWKSM
jgi:hypothetical protein